MDHMMCDLFVLVTIFYPFVFRWITKEPVHGWVTYSNFGIDLQFIPR